jgi:twitching motility protein PilT
MFSESLEMIITQSLCKKKSGGRVAACEVLVGVPAVRNLIRENKIHQIPSTMQTGQKLGMQTLDMALQDLVARGVITREEAALKSPNPALFGATSAGTALSGAKMAAA